MDAWLIVVLIVVALLVIALIAWSLSRKKVSVKKEGQAREALTEARERQARAESARAAADEKAAALRRERAELEQRAAQQERETAALAADADREQAKADELQARARKLAPHLAQNDGSGQSRADRSRDDRDGNPDHAGYADLSGYQAGTAADGRDGYADPVRSDHSAEHDPSGSRAGYDSHVGTDSHVSTDSHVGTDDRAGYDSHVGTDNRAGYDSSGVDDHTRLDLPAGDHYDAPADEGRDATSFRHTAPVTDPEAGVEDTYQDRDGSDRDRDGVGPLAGSTAAPVDGDDRPGRLDGARPDDTDGDRPDNDRPSLKERLTGRPDNR